MLSANIRVTAGDPTSRPVCRAERRRRRCGGAWTPAAVDGFTSAGGIERTFHLRIPARFAGGTGMWSCFPFMVRCHVHTPVRDRAGCPPRDPWCPRRHRSRRRSCGIPRRTRYRRRTAQRHRVRQEPVRSTMATTAATGPSVAGDFNATPDVRAVPRPCRSVTAMLRDQLEPICSHLPADCWYPPLLMIDHVLGENSAATRSRPSGRWSDHRGCQPASPFLLTGNSRRPRRPSVGSRRGRSGPLRQARCAAGAPSPAAVLSNCVRPRQ